MDVGTDVVHRPNKIFIGDAQYGHITQTYFSTKKVKTVRAMATRETDTPT